MQNAQFHHMYPLNHNEGEWNTLLTSIRTFVEQFE